VVVLDVMCDQQMYDPSRYSSDGFHPNDGGYERIATRLAALVNGSGAVVPASCPQMTLVPAG
jgi:lysophospholipase L1-like esterase